MAIDSSTNSVITNKWLICWAGSVSKWFNCNDPGTHDWDAGPHWSRDAGAGSGDTQVFHGRLWSLLYKWGLLSMSCALMLQVHCMFYLNRMLWTYSLACSWIHYILSHSSCLMKGIINPRKILFHLKDRALNDVSLKSWNFQEEAAKSGSSFSC